MTIADPILARPAVMTHPQLTAIQYFAAYPESTLPMALIEGLVITIPAPNDDHQYTLISTSALLFSHVSANNLGQARVAPTYVVLDELNVVQPDLFFVAQDNPHCQRQGNKRWVGPPDLCVEILSPGTAQHDLDYKFRLYGRAGVREDWIISPQERYIDVYQRLDDQLVRFATYGPEDTFQSPLLTGFQFTVVTIFYSDSD